MKQIKETQTANNFDQPYQQNSYKLNLNTPQLKLIKNSKIIHQLQNLSTPIITIGARSSLLSIPSSPSIKSCNKPAKIKTYIQPLKVIEAPVQTLDLDKQISNFILENDSKQMKCILLGFIENVKVNVNNVEFANQIRNQIQALRFTIERLEQQFLEVNSQMNSIALLSSKQFSMIFRLKRI
ncbi:Hypothetical_protein [Hexamita inflata]|uniref:Hypothetical_protein n=1 Tax=Hexamita inflata TaxID=28002 RepID=A0AA86NGH0_9EUKA|nr:Hypothetical protein HINF_LOCUS6231 [Hexamita inflata]